jgi:hypothetical protein
VVWEGWHREGSPYPDLWVLSGCSTSMAERWRFMSKRPNARADSGRSWNWTTNGLDKVAWVLPGAPGAGASMPSMWKACGCPRSPTQRPRPVQPAFGSSTRPSSPLAKNPIG